MSKKLLGILIVCLAAGLGLAQAAQAVVSVGGVSHVVRSGSTGGFCTVNYDEEAGNTVDCTDGGNSGVVNSLQGCLDTAGLGLCDLAPSLNETGNILQASTVLECESGSKYNVATGTNDGTCTVSGSGATKGASCTAGADNLNSTNASCASGCGSTSGSGCCCSGGTSNGCGGGTNCTGK